MSNLNIALRIDASLSGNFDRTFERINRQVHSLSTMGNELQRRQLAMGQALNRAGLNNSDNLTRLRDRYREVEQAINRVTSAQNNLNRSLNFQHNNQNRLNNARSDFAGASMAAGVGVMAGGAVMRAFMQQEDAATDLKIAMMDKNGLVGQFQNLKKEVIFLGNQLPGTTTDFYRLAQALKEQGISDGKLVNGGLRTSAYLNTLLNMDQQTGGQFFAKMLEAHGLAEPDMAKGADIVQRAKFAFGLSKDNMYESMKYYSPNINMLGLKGTDNMQKLFAVQGMGAQVGLEGSSFGTNFAMMLTRMAKGQDMLMMAKRGMKVKARDMLEGSGVSFDFWDKKGNFAGVDNMVKQMEKLNVIKAKYGEKGALEVADAMFGVEAGRPAMIIAQKGYAGYQKNLELMAKQADMAQRIAAKTATLSNAWDAAKGTFVNFLATLGGQFAPELKNLANSLNAFISGPMTAWLSKNKEGVVFAVKLVGALLGLRLVTAGLRLAFALLLSPIAKAWVAIAKLRGALALFGALRLSGLARLPALLQILGLSKLAGVVGKLGRAFWLLGGFIGRSVVSALMLLGRRGVMAATGLGRLAMVLGRGLISGLTLIGRFAVMAATGLGRLAVIVGGRLIGALRLMGTALLWGGRAFLLLGRALIFTPIGAILTAIAIAGYLIYKNWDKIAPVLQKTWNALKAGYAWAVNATTGLIEWFASVPSKLATIGGQMVDGLINGIKAKWGALKATVSEMANSISSQFKGLMQINSPSKLFMKFGRGIAEGTAVGIQNGTPTAVKASDGMANKIANTNYLKNHAKTAMQANDSGSYQSSIHYNPQITVQGNASQDDIKQALGHNQRDFERMLDRANASKNRRAYA